MVLVCCCALAGTEACYRCDAYKKEFGEYNKPHLYEPVCPDESKCADYPHLCWCCKKNKNNKPHLYEPTNIIYTTYG
jgi:hypothetical protein